jgi:N6-adenosine-specific RNA methylase IME4
MMTLGEWKSLGLPLGRTERKLMFAIGDWWLAGAEFGYGVRKQIVNSAGWRGPTYDSCRVAGTVAARFPTKLRRLNIGFVHHQAVRALPNELALPLLDQAIHEGWNQNKMRIEVARVRNARPLDGGDIVDNLQALIDEGRQFRAILADPPWRMSETLGKRGAIDTYYPSLELDAIKRLPVADVADPGCFLFLWCSAIFLPAALHVMEAWGFSYTTNMIWDKDHGFGNGYYFRMRHELLLLGRGPTAPRHFDDCSISSVLRAQRTAHSEKPPIVHSIVERATAGPYLEMFGRRRVEGWTVLGNQLPQSFSTDLLAAD